jgi:uncharacterized protein (TIGR03663 family)
VDGAAEERAIFPRFTLEIALWALLICVALLVRLWGLGAAPLEDEESVRAISAWQLTLCQTPLAWREPLTTVLTAAVFLLFGAGDSTARLVPLVAGITLVSLFFGLRPVIGRSGAFGAALVVSLSPSFVFFSRFLSGDILAALLSLGLVLCFRRYLSHRRSEWIVVAAALVALLLNVGPSGLTFLLAAGLASVTLFATGQIPKAWSEAVTFATEDRPGLLRAVVVFVATFVAAGTGLLSNVGSFGWPSFGDWLSQFGPSTGGRPVSAMAALLLYEPLALGLGLAGAILLFWSWRGKSRPADSAFHVLFMIWAAFGLIVFLLSQREHAGGILMALLPLGILGGELAGKLATATTRAALRDVGILLAPLPFLLVYLWILIAQGSKGLSATPALLLYMALAAAAVVVFLAGIAMRTQGATGVIIVTAGITTLLGAYSIHTTWWVAQRDGPTELLVYATPSADVRQAAALIKDVAVDPTAAKNGGVTVQSSLTAPFAWYLRDVPGLRFAAEIDPGGSGQVAAIGDAPAAKTMTGYVSRWLQLHSTWNPDSVAPARLWRWLMYREPYGTVNTARFVLYTKSA